MSYVLDKENSFKETQEVHHKEYKHPKTLKERERPLETLALTWRMSFEEADDPIDIDTGNLIVNVWFFGQM